MIKVGIYGASGYMGGEALCILLEHPEVEIAWITSRGDKPVEYYHLCSNNSRHTGYMPLLSCD